MTRILTPLIEEDIDNCKYVRIHSPFIFESDVLKRLGLQYRVEIPEGFILDNESVPIVKGSNKRSGAGHDYLCRIDSIPVVTKAIAAEVYRELMQYCYALDKNRGITTRFVNWLRTWLKWGVVRVAPDYFHKHKVMATSLEISGLERDPYIS